MGETTIRHLRRMPAAEMWRDRARQGVDLLFQSLKDLLMNRGLEWAAALAFYTMLSFFPLLLAAALVCSLFVDAQWAVDRLAGRLGEFVPEGEARMAEIVGGAFEQDRRVGLAAMPLLLLTGRRALGTLTQALNLVSDVDEKADRFVRRAVVELMLLLLLGALLGLALSSVFLFDLLWDILRIVPDQRGLLFRLVPGIVRALLLLGAFFVIYRFVPRGERSARAAVVGAVAAMAVFLAAHEVFLTIVPWVARTYGAIYGSLAPALLLMLWFWVVALITLGGGSLASHVKVMQIEGRSAAEAEESHVARIAPAHRERERTAGTGG